MEKNREIRMEKNREIRPSKNSTIDAHMNLETMATGTGPTQVLPWWFPALREELGKSPHF